MADFSTLPLAAQLRNRSRSMGIKLIVVCFVGLLMAIPAALVYSVVQDRTSRSTEEAQEISTYVGGKQTFLGPTLAIPYSIPPASPSYATQYGVYLVFPARAAADFKVSTEERRRSLFKVPVFQADSKFDASFDLTNVPSAAPQGAIFDWSRAEIVVGVSDARGALADTTLTTDGKTFTLGPSAISQNLSFGADQNLRLVLLGAKVGDIAKPNTQFNVTSALRFSGAQRIAVLAYGKTTNLTMQGDWPSPSFDGGFLPAHRTVSSNGFKAEWSLPVIARGVRAEGQSDAITGLDATSLGVSFIEVADPYQSVNRAVKYLPLFVGLVFLSYFVFEVTTRKRLHPAQYILVGIAQINFYLLLLSLAERIGFDFGFLIAGIATVALLSATAGWIFASRKQGLRALSVFSLLYVLIYMLLRLEDNSLLVGAIASFLAVAAVMYFTRKIDWYSSIPAGGMVEKQNIPLS
jgi:inner membrane protein